MTIVTKLLKNIKELEPVGLHDQYKSIYDVIEQTVCFGTNNSIMITGPRGVGKSMILTKVLRNLKQKNEFIVVQLNGLVHTNDRLALRSILQQLNIHHEYEQQNVMISDIDFFFRHICTNIKNITFRNKRQYSYRIRSGWIRFIRTTF
jgi:Cdc6-like AAA superfamily ATPase